METLNPINRHLTIKTKINKPVEYIQLHELDRYPDERNHHFPENGSMNTEFEDEYDSYNSDFDLDIK